MNFLIDGHNLIGSNLFPDIHLADEDDEAKLVRQLKVWNSRVRQRGRASITVIFDRGIPGGIDVKMGGSSVEVIFAADPAQADDLIRRRLRQAKKGLILVTNDEALIQVAATYRVRCWRGEEFVDRMRVKAPETPEAGMEEDVQVSKAEVEEWLALFRARQEARKAAKQRRISQNGAQKPGAAPAKPPGKPADGSSGKSQSAKKSKRGDPKDRRK